MKLSSWGRYPRVNSSISYPQNLSSIENYIKNTPNFIPRGLGRSYGDSALANQVLCLNRMDHFIDFDEEKGLLNCEAGVSFSTILEIIVPKGWFLPVTPGTKFVTLGGAIASDVHGKNHHKEGCISEYILSFQLMLSQGIIIECSPYQHPDLFYATCGGMGLTGVIISAKIQLKAINSAFINQRTIKAENLEALFSLFESHHSATYSVAWMDCLATGKNLGLSLFMVGEHAQIGEKEISIKKKWDIPFIMPSCLLNPYSIRAFNTLYYHKQMKKSISKLTDYDQFFYPLDGIGNWNYMYGKNGFTQYQFVLPKEAGLKGMTEILKKITLSRRGSFLSVLKACGPANSGLLSFPIEGYSLALDFKLQAGLFDFLDHLDNIVAYYGGRVYLTKDVRMSEAIFKKTYPLWEKFCEIRAHYGADKQFHSLQSRRLGL